ncbi:pseudouridylate synthase TRUB2, mitochondrial [Bombina bombina]|uniref:pseudouridylate synthase TRUB2, mitochondrial n=1 Tax=Bombina bombina TaxID=8345 RepID=UPI00235ADE96|nr:pseudouridylate synthase TRUB2, mitochondrial [Bombina bombina]
MVRYAPAVYRMLHGMFAVYKPPGVKWKMIRDTIETKLLKDLNSLKQPPPQHHVRFLPAGTEGNDRVELTRVVTSVPVLADHVLVKGPTYTHLKVGAGHRLDTQSSGVLVLAIGHGNKLLTEMYNSHFTKDYTLRGTFGKATNDFTDTGNVIEKTTYDHITRDKLERILAVIQGSNQKALLVHSHVDLKTQEAYELAVEGQLRPIVKSPPIILGMRCLDFSPPDFTLEVQCMHETQQYLRKLIHEIGLELKSSATCSQVRRTRDGPFTLDCARTHNHWGLDSICQAIRECREIAAEFSRARELRSAEMLEHEEPKVAQFSKEEEELRL